MEPSLLGGVGRILLVEAGRPPQDCKECQAGSGGEGAAFEGLAVRCRVGLGRAGRLNPLTEPTSRVLNQQRLWRRPHLIPPLTLEAGFIISISQMQRLRPRGAKQPAQGHVRSERPAGALGRPCSLPGLSDSPWSTLPGGTKAGCRTAEARSSASCPSPCVNGGVSRPGRALSPTPCMLLEKEALSGPRQAPACVTQVSRVEQPYHGPWRAHHSPFCPHQPRA